MAEAGKIGTGNLTPATISSEDSGKINGKKAVQWQKPLSIVLILLGVVVLGGAGVGLASFGIHQGWWAAGALSNIPQIYSIVMMAAGGAGGIILLIGGIVGTVKSGCKGGPEQEESTDPFVLDQIESFTINRSATTNTKIYALLYRCTIKFADDRERKVWLRVDEISNFVRELDETAVTNNTKAKFDSGTTKKGFQPQEILDRLDDLIAEREAQL